MTPRGKGPMRLRQRLDAEARSSRSVSARQCRGLVFKKLVNTLVLERRISFSARLGFCRFEKGLAGQARFCLCLLNKACVLRLERRNPFSARLRYDLPMGKESESVLTVVKNLSSSSAKSPLQLGSDNLEPVRVPVQIGFARGACIEGGGHGNGYEGGKGFRP